jgi:hypothetical protein
MRTEATEEAPPAVVTEPAVLETASESERAPAGTETAEASAPTAWLSGELVLPPDVPSDEHAELVLSAFPISKEEDEWMAESSDEGWQEKGRMAPGFDGRFRLPLPAGRASLRVELLARYLYLEDRVEVEDPAKPLVLEPKVGGALRFHLVPPKGSKLDATELVGRTIPMTWPRSGLYTGIGPHRDLLVGADLELFAGGLSPEDDYELVGPAMPFAKIVMNGERVIAGLVREVEVALVEGLDLAGRVIDETGVAVQGARVEAQCKLEHEGGSRWWVSDDMETTQDGHFSFRAVHPALEALEVSRDGYRKAKVLRDAIEEGGGLEEIELVLPHGESITVVAHLPDGRPVEGADVRCSPAQHGPNVSLGRADGETDGSGRVVLSGLGRGEFDLVVEARLAEDVEASTVAPVLAVPRPGEARVWCASSSTVSTGSTIQVILAPPAGISGIVVDRDGAPVTSFRVEAAKVREEPKDFPHFGDNEFFFSSDASEEFERADGRFEWDLPVGSWRVRASAEGFLDCRSMAVVLPGAIEPLRFELDRAASISGTVLDPGGRPVEGASISSVWITTGLRSSRGFGRDTDATGAFQSRDLEPGRIELVATAEGFAPSEPQLVEVGFGETRSDVVLRLQRGGKLEVRVLVDGAPAAGVDVHARSAERESYDENVGSTSAKGDLTTEVLAPGEYLVTARPERGPFLQGRIAVVDGETTRLTLGGEVPVAVNVRGHVSSGGTPMSGARLAVYEASSGSDLGSGATAADGSYALALPSGGAVVFAVSGPEGSRALFFHRELPSSGEHELDFDLPTCEIRGHIRRADGEPLGFWTEVVVLEDSVDGVAWSGSEIAETRSGEDGSWACTNLPPGTYAVQASCRLPGMEDLPVPARHDGISLQEGEVVEGIDLVLDAAGVIEGAVRSSDGRIPADARVFARDSSGRLVHPMGFEIIGGGRFRATGLPAGRVYLEAVDATRATAQPSACEVHAGASTTLELALVPATNVEIRVENAPAELDGARIRLRDERGWEYGHLRAPRAPGSAPDESSRRFGPLHAGHWTISLTLSSGRSAAQSFDLTGEPEHVIALDLGQH